MEGLHNDTDRIRSPPSILWRKRGRVHSTRGRTGGARRGSSDWTPRREEISFGRRLEQGVTLHGLPALRVCLGRQRGWRFHSQHCVSLSLTHPLCLLTLLKKEKGGVPQGGGAPSPLSEKRAWGD